jgi:hypothetical protein
MVSKKRILMENQKFNFFVEQDFPVEKHTIGKQKFKEIRVIGCNSSSKISFLCDYFSVEVVKDIEGLITFIVTGKLTYEEREKTGRSEIDIMRTDDFNRAYDLKNNLDTLAGRKPSDRQLMPCYGSLQREKTWLD